MKELLENPEIRGQWRQVMNDTGIIEPPIKDAGKVVWTRAVGLALKSDTTRSLVLLKRDLYDVYHVVKMYGSVAAAVKIEAVYPYEWLDDRYVYQTTDYKDAMAYLKKSGVSIKVGMTWNAVRMSLINLGIKKQFEIIKERKNSYDEERIERADARIEEEDD